MERAGFDDEFIYREINLPMEARQIPFEFESEPEVTEVFGIWKGMADKKMY